MPLRLSLAFMLMLWCRGKHSPSYAPSMDMGAYVVIINCEKVKVTGSKFTDKTYFTHYQGRPGHYRFEHFNQLQEVSREGMAYPAQLRYHVTCCPGRSVPLQQGQPAMHS